MVPAEQVQQFLAQWESGQGKSLIQYFDAPTVVNMVCRGWLGFVGSILALLGVVAAPIISGDTAFRSARLIIADFLHLEQHTVRRRFYICIPMFASLIALLVWNLENPDGFNIIWQYFGWANQTLSIFTLWTITVYLVEKKKLFFITLIPAFFMTAVCSTFLFVSPQALGLNLTIGYGLGGVVLIIALVWFFVWYRKSYMCKHLS